jgi:predicted acyltransferase
MGMSEGQRVEPGRGRLVSLDAYRGFVMALLVAGPLLYGIGSDFPGRRVFDLIAAEFSHVDYQGCHLWDLIMPSFMLLVGVSLPFSTASRVARGESKARIWGHVLWRSLLFMLLGLLVSSKGHLQTRWVFQGLLQQFALATPFAYLFVGKRPKAQAAILAAILVADWTAFALYPVHPRGFAFHDVNLPDVPAWAGLYAHWNRGANLAVDFDRWLLPFFPGNNPFRFESGGQTLNFITSIATMGIGVMAGEMLRGPSSVEGKLKALLRWGVGLLVAGVAAGLTVCPLVKEIWTPSWVLFTGGITLLILAAFFWAVELRGWKAAVFPLVVLGTNSLAVYLLNALAFSELVIQAGVHLTRHWALQVTIAVLAIWLIAFWMYRRKIFLKI